MKLRNVALWLCALCGVEAVAAGVLPGPLVTPEWLAAHRAEVTVIDVRDEPDGYLGAPEFETDAAGRKTLAELKGHIPGALLVDFADVRTTREIEGRKIAGMVPEAAQFQALMRSAGVPAGRPLVIVANGLVIEDYDTAARLYWTLKYYGSDELALLDGGTARWISEGRPTEAEAPARVAGNWAAQPPRAALFADSAAVQAAAASRVQLVDARPLAFYFGLTKRPAVAAHGHIPGALPFPTELRARPQGGGYRFLSADEYRNALAGLGVDPRQPTITYCNTGHMASGAWFVMSEVLGNRQVSLYDGSMVEWANGVRPVSLSR
jgi:thiosulfate/3-mercaptopyruvate sulfurtransferase